MIRFLKRLWFKLTYDEIALKCSRPLGKSLFIIIVLMSTICSAQTSIMTADVNGVTKLYARLNRPAPVIDPVPVYPPNPVYIGIPSPTFGINETYRMYDYEPNQNPDLTYNPSDSGGYYTHYVDSTDPHATNSSNTYGTKAKPRVNIPYPVPAGSIVEIHNDSTANDYGYIQIGGEGTEQYPIFYRGVDNPNIDLRVGIGYYANSSYIIVEGMKFRKGSVSSRATSTSFETNHIAVRDCDFATSNEYNEDSGFFISGQKDSTNQTHNIVLYDCRIYNNGILDPEVDSDIGGVRVQTNCSYVWVLDCTMYNNSCNGVIAGGTETGTNAPDHVYIGGNTAYHNRQTGFWTKTAYDIVFSQNISYEPGTGASGGFGMQYDPQRVWFLFNTVYNADRGFRSGSGLVGPANPDYDNLRRKELYVIGNLIYDCNIAGLEFDGHEPPTNSPIMFNTIYNCPIGIYNGYYDAKINAFNNIIANCTTVIDFLNEYNSDVYSSFDYNLLNGTGNIKWNNTYANLAAFQAGSTQGDNCLEADPLFVDAENNNFDLQSESPFKSIEESSAIQTVIDRFYELYDIDISNEIRALRLTGVQQAP